MNAKTIEKMRITVLVLGLASIGLGLGLALAWESESESERVKECKEGIAVFDQCLTECKKKIRAIEYYMIEAFRWFEILAGYVQVQFLNLEPFVHTGEPLKKGFKGYDVVVSDFFEHW